MFNLIKLFQPLTLNFFKKKYSNFSSYTALCNVSSFCCFYIVKLICEVSKYNIKPHLSIILGSCSFKNPFNSRSKLNFFIKTLYCITIIYFFYSVTSWLYKISLVLGCIKIFLLLFVSYFFINVWFYFYNKYKYSKYTTQVSRFWKRTYMLFWLVEFFLFFIFIYLHLVNSKECYYTYLTKGNIVSFDFFLCDVDTYINVIIMCILSNIILFLKKFNIVISRVILILLLYLYLKVVFFELTKLNESVLLLYSSTKTGLFSQSSIKNSNTTFYSGGIRLDDSFDVHPNYSKYRVYSYMHIVISILKFWHVMFIFFIFVIINFSTNKLLIPSNSLLSVNLQNTTYLFFFYSTWYLYAFFKLVPFFFEMPYAATLNTSLINSFFFETKLSYVFI